MAAAYMEWIKAKGWGEKIPIKKPTEADAALFEQLVAMGQLAKIVASVSLACFRKQARRLRYFSRRGFGGSLVVENG